ncbi:hypothetical protein [Owenweeksia hongkongensis]|uniref:hypothetical protein n=1 Tax=Owenweeksia hongkongensis TaxID=253245 RepID=UPI003A9314F5
MGFIKNRFTPKIAVVGGTTFDANKGAVYLRKRGIPCDAIGMNNEPEETAAMYKHPKQIVQLFHEKVGSLQYTDIVIFCNSLSFIHDWKSVYPSRITELTHYYNELLQKVDIPKTAIIVADESTAKNISDLAGRQNITASELNIFPSLDLIKEIEKSTEGEQYHLVKAEIEKYISKGYTEIILACTHLDHPDFFNIAEVKIHQPGLEMLEEFIASQQNA